ncbi:SigE family RNA polymerase sigma factor [Plantactinospora sp. KLBMP9567]|uniref:SigE family RNA polymerase sigma factor n=1 Tax=Plantactinospora sp. KLBMP9567 TaxID=3085900 RepID=UPI0029814B68|nr:SigE family RNA polymerase sigma factor [Plantactinospora sp. KLBMP9567]MDW5330269.1 SigE family RNA polymerase sigma factor [Plantactinospora sp. KLBMP9567]
MTFDEFVTTRGPSLVRLARLLSGDRHRAEDLVQDVLARAYVHWRRISATGRPDVYVRQMLVNANRSWWRLRRNHEMPYGDSTREEAVASGDSVVIERDRLWRMVLTLPYRQRAVLVLRYYEDLDDAAIGEILDCSLPTVRTHAMRALAKLRDLGAQELATEVGGIR